MDFSSLLFGNPVTFLAFLAEVIKRTILATDRNDTVDVCQIITEAAGGRMGLPVDAEQLKSFLVNNDLHNFTMECPIYL